MNWVIEKKKTQWVLDADIKSYFDQIPHKKLLDCLKVKIKDPNILWLVKRMGNNPGWLVNFADDFIACFSEKEDAEKFYVDLKRRLADFGLVLQNEKTKLIEFGSRAQASREAKGENRKHLTSLGLRTTAQKARKAGSE